MMSITVITRVRKNLGEKVARLRRERGLSQPDLARLTKCSTSAISRCEKGENTPSVDDLEEIAKALGVPLSELFRIDERGSDEKRADAIQSMSYRLRGRSPADVRDIVDIVETIFRIKRRRPIRMAMSRFSEKDRRARVRRARAVEKRFERERKEAGTDEAT